MIVFTSSTWLSRLFTSVRTVRRCEHQGIETVIYQKQQGLYRVISYASRGLSKAKKHYPAHKLEFLCLKCAVTEKFNYYLYGGKFALYTDNNPITLTTRLTSAKLDAIGHLWLAALSALNFDIIYLYRPARSNADADVLSRHPTLNEQISVDSVKAF